MTKRERTAAHLMALYWTGAGDAGTDRAIFSFHKKFPLSEMEEQEIFDAGNSAHITHEGIVISQSDYFMILADKLSEI